MFSELSSELRINQGDLPFNSRLKITAIEIQLIAKLSSSVHLTTPDGFLIAFLPVAMDISSRLATR